MSSHPLQTTGRTVLSVLVLSLALIVPASATALDGEVPTHVAGLHHALGQRIAAIEALPEPTKTELKESKSLAKARDHLEQYLGDDDKQDLKRLVVAASAVVKAKSPDGAIQLKVEEIRDRLDQLGLTLRQSALGLVDLVEHEKTGIKVGKTVDKADTLREKGLAQWPGHHGKGAKVLSKAVNKYRAALSQGFKKQVKEATKLPNDARPTGLTVLTGDPQVHHPFKVLVATELAEPAQELSIALRAFFAEDVDGPPDTPVRDAVLGVHTLHDVPAGPRQDELEFRIPIMRDETILTRDDLGDIGWSIDVSGTTAVSGAHSGNQAIVFERDDGGPGAWGEVATLLPPSGLASFFGRDVSIHGDTIVVGASNDDTLGTDVGAAHIYERNQGGPGNWGFVKTLYPDDPPGGEMLFGASVAIDTDTIVVGAYREIASNGQLSAGAAYIYRRNKDGPEAWGQAARLQNPTPASAPFEDFGYDVAIDGSTVVVSAIGVDNFTGEAHVFGKDVGGVNNWGHVQALPAPGDLEEFTTFGEKIDFDGETIVVGAYNDTWQGLASAGTVHVWEQQGPTWLRIAVLDAGPDLLTSNFFGRWLAVEGELIIAGGSGAPGADGAAVFLRTEPIPGDPEWDWLMKLEDKSGEVLEGGFSPGVAAMDGDTIVVGNNTDDVVHFLTGMERIEPGDWYIAVETDPHGRMLETLAEDSEDNNLLIDDDATGILGDKINAPNVILESVELSPHKMFVDTDGTSVVPMSLNARISMTGKHDGPLPGVVLRGFASMLVDVGSAPQPVVQTGFFEPVPNLQVENLQLPPLVVNDPLDIHVDFLLELPPETPLVDVGNYVADFTFFVEKAGQYEPEGDDDQLSIDDFPYNVIPIDDCSYTQSFVTSLGPDEVRGTIDMAAHLEIVGSKADLDPTTPVLFAGSEAEAGMVATVFGVGSVDFFGVSADLIEAGAVLERDPIQDYGFLAADLVFQEPLTGKSFVLYAFGPYDSVDLQQDGLNFPDGVSECDGGFCFEKTFDVDKSFEKEAVFLVSGIPVTVTGTVEGAIGIDITAQANDELSLEVEPFLETSASARAEVGVCDFEFDDPTGLTDFLGFSFSGGGCVGADGEITLIDDRFRAKVGVGMSVVEGIDGLGMAATSIDTAMCFHVSNDLDMLHGELTAFAVWTTPAWCSSFIGIPYPCGTKAHKAEIDIVSWHGFSFDHVLIDETHPLCCVPVVGLPICPPEGTSVCSLDD